MHTQIYRKVKEKPKHIDARNSSFEFLVFLLIALTIKTPISQLLSAICQRYGRLIRDKRWSQGLQGRRKIFDFFRNESLLLCPQCGFEGLQIQMDTLYYSF
jgi:hypothetical protein